MIFINNIVGEAFASKIWVLDLTPGKPKAIYDFLFAVFEVFFFLE